MGVGDAKRINVRAWGIQLVHELGRRDRAGSPVRELIELKTEVSPRYQIESWIGGWNLPHLGLRRGTGAGGGAQGCNGSSRDTETPALQGRLERPYLTSVAQ